MKPQFKGELRQKIVQGALSLWIIFHLLVAVVLPNGTSLLGQQFHGLLFPYGAAVGLNVPWNFFAPDPAHIIYFKYTVFYRNELLEDLREPIEGFAPASRDVGPFSMNERREAFAMRFMILFPERVDLFLGPWFCRKFPGASSVKLEHIYTLLPSLQVSQLEAAPRGPEESEKFELVNREISCRGENDEISGQ